MNTLNESLRRLFQALNGVRIALDSEEYQRSGKAHSDLEEIQDKIRELANYVNREQP